jgi:hypothetical protein
MDLFQPKHGWPTGDIRFGWRIGKGAESGKVSKASKQ